MSVMDQVSVILEETEAHYRAPITPLTCCLDRLRPTLVVTVVQMLVCTHLPTSLITSYRQTKALLCRGSSSVGKNRTII